MSQIRYSVDRYWLKGWGRDWDPGSSLTDIRWRYYQPPTFLPSCGGQLCPSKALTCQPLLVVLMMLLQWVGQTACKNTADMGPDGPSFLTWCWWLHFCWGSAFGFILAWPSSWLPASVYISLLVLRCLHCAVGASGLKGTPIIYALSLVPGYCLWVTPYLPSTNPHPWPCRDCGTM
jgi:hypothetical protein